MSRRGTVCVSMPEAEAVALLKNLSADQSGKGQLWVYPRFRPNVVLSGKQSKLNGGLSCLIFYSYQSH
jgi:hypothetical protein